MGSKRLLTDFSTRRFHAVGLLTSLATSAGAAGIGPAGEPYDAKPGDAIELTKTVTPEALPMPDVVLTVDRTGSMGAAIDNVKAQLDAQFAVAQYGHFARTYRHSTWSRT
jgi:hypothetical protein